MTDNFDEITITYRLKNYRELLDEYDNLIAYKAMLISQINGLKSVDLSKTKVMTGNKRAASVEEMYAIRLEECNKDLAELTAGIDVEGERLEEQINRLPKHLYKLIIKFYYFYRMNWNDIVERLCADKSDLYLLDGQKKKYLNPKYVRAVFYRRSRALEELERISKTPYIKAENKQERLF